MENITDNQQTDFVNSSNVNSSNYVDEVLRVISAEALKHLVNSNNTEVLRVISAEALIHLVNSSNTHVHVVGKHRDIKTFKSFSSDLLESIRMVAGTGQIFIINKDLNILIHYDCVDNKIVTLNLP